MDDSDDLFNDSFVLDDNVLEALQLAETKYTSNATSSTAQSSSKTISPSQPPAKRQKITYGVESSSDDENPEISVKGDGTYNILTRNALLVAVNNDAAVEGPRRRGTSVYSRFLDHILTVLPASQSVQAVPSNGRRDNAVRTERAQSNIPSSRAIERTTERTTNGLITNGASTSAAFSSSPKPAAVESQLQDELAKLRAQVEEVR